MEIEFQTLQKQPTSGQIRNSSILIGQTRKDHEDDGDDHHDDEKDEDNHLRYTSLKDVIMNPSVSFHHRVSSQERVLLSGIDSSSIAIKNELVKWAASAYLHSAVVLAARNQNWFERLSSKVKYWAATAAACFRPVCRILVCMVGGVYGKAIPVS